MSELDRLRERVTALENNARGRWRPVAQFLLFPALLLGVTYYLDQRIENARQSFQVLELEVRKIEASHRFIDEIFSGSVERAMLSEKLMSRIVDEELAAEIAATVRDYYGAEMLESIEKGDLERAAEIRSAALKIKSTGAKQLISELSKAEFLVIVSSLRDRSAAIRSAEQLRERGYPSEVIKSVTGYYGVAIGRYEFDDAMGQRSKAIDEKAADETAYLMNRSRITEYVFPGND